jgi:1-acyl-sn-glycerol-3-phosphate acyltransferase
VRGREPLYWTVAAILDLYVRATVRLSVDGQENIPHHGAAVLVANHVSYFDPVVLGVIAKRRGRSVRFLVVDEVFRKPVIGHALRAMRQINVGTGPRGVLMEIGRALGRGDLVLIYPEGTIPTGPVRPRRGAAVVAIDHGVPVIPIASSGLERRSFQLRRRTASVRIGPPIDLTTYTRALGSVRMTREASDLILESIRRLRSMASKA